MAERQTAVVLIAHGTVESLDDLPEFLANIRRGHPAPPELVTEVRRRYAAIGGRSPLLAITHQVAHQLEAKLGLPVRIAMRLFHPYPKDVLAKLAAEGITRVITVPLAQHSAAIYGGAMKAAAKAVAPAMEIVCADNWGRRPELTAAFAESVAAALAPLLAEPGQADDTAVVFTAHSLPKTIIDAGDPYEREVRGSAEDVARSLPEGVTWRVAFQSQGIGSGVEWLGPELQSTLAALAKEGKKQVVVAPIGFLADHVEILYDLDIEAKAWAADLGISLYRSASLNADSRLVDAIAVVVKALDGG